MKVFTVSLDKWGPEKAFISRAEALLFIQAQFDTYAEMVDATGYETLSASPDIATVWVQAFGHRYTMTTLELVGSFN